MLILLIPWPVKASIVVMDMDTNRVLYGSNENQARLIASTTKIMTAMVVINNANLDDIVTIDQSILKSFGSGIYIEIGEKMSVRDLLYGLLLRSGNDAAIALSVYVGGSEDGFALLMNQLASSIGMSNTHFINASGLENENGEGNMSTAKDMGKLMSYAMQNKEFQTITKTYHHIVKTNFKTYDWYNKNKLLKQYKYTTGGKTGYTEKAYRTLVTSATKDNKNLTVVTLNERDDFNIHESLYEEYFKKYKLVNLIEKKTFLRSENMYVENDFSMLLNDSEIPKVKIEVVKTNDALDRMGYVVVSLDGNEYYRENIYLEKKEEKLSFFEKVKKFIRGFFGLD